MANYISSLTGPQMDDALMQMNNRIPEGWAVGTKDGTPVPPTSQFYHNNAKYYAERAKQDIQDGVDAANAAAARAEAAVPAGTDGAVFFNVQQNLTDAQKAQARKNIGATISNPNLFVNPWFTVNQRGARGNMSDGYRLDMWKVAKIGGTVNYNQPTRIVTLTASSNEASIQQILDPVLRSALNGKTVTFSVLTSSNVLHSVSFIYDATATDMGIPFPTFPQAGYWYGGNYASCLKVSYGNAPVTLAIKAIKLEIGSISTLANDTVPDYQQELAKCQRCFINYINTYSGGMTLFSATNSTETTADVALPVPVPMEKTPTATITGGASLFDPTGHYFAVSSVQVLAVMNNIVHLRFTASGLTRGEAYRLVLTTQSTLSLSADR